MGGFRSLGFGGRDAPDASNSNRIEMERNSSTLAQRHLEINAGSLRIFPGDHSLSYVPQRFYYRKRQSQLATFPLFALALASLWLYSMVDMSGYSMVARAFVEQQSEMMVVWPKWDIISLDGYHDQSVAVTAKDKAILPSLSRCHHRQTCLSCPC